MPSGQFSHFRDKMSLARDTGHRGSIPGRSRPFRDGWQAYLFCLTETWIKPITTEIKRCTPPNYTFLSFPRTYSDISSSSSGGGTVITGFLIHEPFTQLPASLPDFSSFESSNVTLKLPHTKIISL